MTNLKELSAEEAGNLILNSDDYVVLRYDKEKEAIHVHVKEQNSISLIPILISTDQNLFDYIEKALQHIKSTKGDNQL